jgi:hypothetical protein
MHQELNQLFPFCFNYYALHTPLEENQGAQQMCIHIFMKDSSTVLDVEPLEGKQSKCASTDFISDKVPISPKYYKTILSMLIPSLYFVLSHCFDNNLEEFVETFGLVFMDDNKTAQSHLLGRHIPVLSLYRDNKDAIVTDIGSHLWLAKFLPKVNIS